MSVEALWRSRDQTHRGCVVEMEMGFLDTLAVNALGIGQTKQSFFEVIAELDQRTCSQSLGWNTNSFSFQKAKAMFIRPCVSETPAIPSSPHR